MRKIFVILSLSSMVFCFQAQSQTTSDAKKMVFVPLHIYLDSGNEHLAAYQFELKTLAEQVKIVGVEGGDHPAFGEPPYYDPAALMNNRIIIAAFNTGNNLPTGKVRIATLHLQITGNVDPDYELLLTIAADADGQRIPAEITYEQGDIQ